MSEELEDEYLDERSADGNEVPPASVESEVTTVPPIDRKRLNEEIEELERYTLWARSVGVDTKSKALLTALETGFSRMAEMGANRKALVFTESRRTQQYLKSSLEANGYAGQVVLFSGSNTDAESQLIYERWKAENTATGRATGSKTIDIRTALINEHFRDRATRLRSPRKQARRGSTSSFVRWSLTTICLGIPSGSNSGSVGVTVTDRNTMLWLSIF